jgi:acetyl esterase/lipase
MRRNRILAMTAALLAAPVVAGPMRWADLLDRPQPKPDATIAYGADPLQHVDLWLPKRAGAHPVVLMVHGGCWQTGIAKADIMNWIADDLRRRGIAVWNVEYRGIDRPGGGYPGTFLDVARAADLLETDARKYHLRADRIVAVGHSAGGHLALWLAARPGLPKTSPLSMPHPLKITAAVSQGGLPDLAAASVPPGNTCDNDPVPGLVGKPSAARRDVYADTSPAELPDPGTMVTLINGTLDRIAPPDGAAAYARKRKAHRVTIPDEGHVELITPDTRSWAAAVRVIEEALR